MKTNNYQELKNNVKELNDLNDQINLIEWNKDDGPKFESVGEMREFYTKLSNNEFDYLFGNNTSDNDMRETESKMVETYEHTLNDYFFFIYSFQKEDKVITYLSLKNLKENDIIDNLCGKESPDTKTAHTCFIDLKETITNNSLEDIINNLITWTQLNINKLKKKLAMLTNES